MTKLNCLPETKWKHKEHLATPTNIVKQELSDAYELRYNAIRPTKVTFKPKPLKNGPVKWLVKDGKQLD
jgi:hypothetical protein